MINLDPYLTPYTKIKLIKDLDMNLLEEKSHDTGSGNNFLDLTPKAPKKKDKLDYIKSKMFILRSFIHSSASVILLWIFLAYYSSVCSLVLLGLW